MPNQLVKAQSEFNSALQLKLPSIEQALPPAVRQEAARFAKIGQLYVMGKPEFWSCTTLSLVQALVDAAGWGLALDGKLCYGIKYGKELKAHPSYIGLIQVAKRNKVIQDAMVEEVHEKDDFERGTRGGKPFLNHKQAKGDRGEVTGVFSIIRTEHGWTSEWMSIDEINEVRDHYAQKSSPAWKKSPGEMRKKVVLRRHMKMYADNVRVLSAIARLDEDFVVDEEPSDFELSLDLLEKAKPKPEESVSPKKKGSAKEAAVRDEYISLIERAAELEVDASAFGVSKDDSVEDIEKVCVRLKELLDSQ